MGALPRDEHRGRGPGHRHRPGPEPGHLPGLLCGGDDPHPPALRPGNGRPRPCQKDVRGGHPRHLQPGAALPADLLPEHHPGGLVGGVCPGAGGLLQIADLPVPARQRHRAGDAAHRGLQLRREGERPGAADLLHRAGPVGGDHGAGHRAVLGRPGQPDRAVLLQRPDHRRGQHGPADHQRRIHRLVGIGHFLRGPGGPGDGRTLPAHLPAAVRGGHPAAGLCPQPAVGAGGGLARLLDHRGDRRGGQLGRLPEKSLFRHGIREGAYDPKSRSLRPGGPDGHLAGRQRPGPPLYPGGLLAGLLCRRAGDAAPGRAVCPPGGRRGGGRLSRPAGGLHRGPVRPGRGPGPGRRQTAFGPGEGPPAAAGPARLPKEYEGRFVL